MYVKTYAHKTEERQMRRGRGKVVPATPRERAESMQQWMDQLIDMLAGETDPRAIESLESQIARQRVALDNAWAEVAI